MYMKKIVMLFLIIDFLLVSYDLFSQSVSLITYGIEDGDVIVKWRYENNNVSFSVYRSSVLVSNVSSFSNNINYINKVGTFPLSELQKKDNYFYIVDSTPNIGTNYYFVLVNKDGQDVMEFVPEQNYSVGFLLYIPLPKVSVDFISDVNSSVIKWGKVNGVEGYLVYKLPNGFDGDLAKVNPVATLSSNETIFFDVIPSDTNFSYVVVPFVGQITNYYFSRKYNSIFVSMSKKSVPTVSMSNLEEVGSVLLPQENKKELIYITNYITNVSLETNIVVITNFVWATNAVSDLDKTYNQALGSTNFSSSSNYATDHKPLKTYQIYEDYEDKLKFIVSKFFNKKDYLTSKSMLKELLDEIGEESEIRGRVMIYLARVEYALGNKNEAISLLFKAKRFYPEEADFWLSRFLVNK